MTLKITCAWCDKDMGEKDGQGISGISHGICQDCYDRITAGTAKPTPLAFVLGNSRL